jgi:hypothetical protein
MVIKAEMLRCLGYVCRMQEIDVSRKLMFKKPEDIRRVCIGLPSIRRLNPAEGNLKIRGFRNWRRKSQGRDQWRAIVEDAKFRDGLWRHQKKKKKK